MLNENLKLYAQLLEQEEALKNSKEALKQEILQELDALGETSYVSPEGISANLTNKANIKYSDELSIIKYLKENGYSQFVTEKVDSTRLNKELKKLTPLTESLQPFYDVTEVRSLTVKQPLTETLK